MFTRVYFPAATPYIFTGFKLAASYTVIGVIASEFIQAESGVGWFVGFSYNNFAIQNMYAAILLILLFAIAVNSLLLRARAAALRAAGDDDARRAPAAPRRLDTVLVGQLALPLALLAIWQIVGMLAGDFYVATPVQALDACDGAATGSSTASARRCAAVAGGLRDRGRRSGCGSASRSGSTRFWRKVFEPITLSRLLDPEGHAVPDLPDRLRLRPVLEGRVRDVPRDLPDRRSSP